MTDPRQRLRAALDALDATFAPLSQAPFPVGGCTYLSHRSRLRSPGRAPAPGVGAARLFRHLHDARSLGRLPWSVPPVDAPDRTSAVTTGTLTPWLAAWAEPPTEASDLHLSDALDDWLMRDELADLRLGFYDELHATPELLPWFLSLEDGRIGAAQLMEIERIAYR